MSDIGRRIERYRLTRYARSRSMLPMGWVWVALAAWLLWSGALSDHSFLQLWRLERRNATELTALEHARTSIQDLERKAASPKDRREQAERVLREQNGMARPGEIIYRVQDDDAEPGKPDAAPPSEAAPVTP